MFAGRFTVWRFTIIRAQCIDFILFISGLKSASISAN
jgi:hypothetical protein